MISTHLPLIIIDDRSKNYGSSLSNNKWVVSAVAVLAEGSVNGSIPFLDDDDEFEDGMDDDDSRFGGSTVSTKSRHPAAAAAAPAMADVARRLQQELALPLHNQSLLGSKQMLEKIANGMSDHNRITSLVQDEKTDQKIARALAQFGGANYCHHPRDTPNITPRLNVLSSYAMPADPGLSGGGSSSPQLSAIESLAEVSRRHVDQSVRESASPIVSFQAGVNAALGAVKAVEDGKPEMLAVLGSMNGNSSYDYLSSSLDYQRAVQYVIDESKKLRR